MSDAKKCDRCGGFYTVGSWIDIRPSLEGIRIFGIRYTNAANVGIGDCDLCPTCAEKVWKYIQYDEPAEDHEAIESALNKDPIIMSEDKCKKRIVSFEVINKCSDNISHLKEMYGIGMSSRNITITYWPNFDTYLMTALVSSNNVEHQMVKGDVDYETLAIDLLRFFEYLDMAYGDDTKECDDE